MSHSKSLHLHFLGTGGGRFVMVTQRRRTAGIRLIQEDILNLHLDPGPGALIFSNWARLNPQGLDGILVSHSHPDHYCDAEVLIEGMSHGTTKKRGLVAAPRSVLRGNDVCGPAISRYHQGLVSEIAELSPDREARLGQVRIRATKAVHSDPDAIGFRLDIPDMGEIGYSSDTALYDGIEDYYRETWILILCTIRPRGSPLPLHLSVDDAAKLVTGAKPRYVVLTGFGMGLFGDKAAEQAKWMEKETGIPTTAAEDGMEIRVGDKIEVKSQKKGTPTRTIEA